MTETSETKVKRLRRIFPNHVTGEEADAELGTNPKRRRQWETTGLPVIRRGHLKLYDVDHLRAFIEGRPIPVKRRRRERREERAVANPAD